MAIRRIGINFDGSTVHMTIGRREIPLISESHGDNVKSEWVWRMGDQVPEADTPGQYEPEEGSIKMSCVNARTLLFPLLPQFGAANVRRLAVVTLTHPEIGTDSDALVDFRIMGSKQSLEAGAKGVEIELKTRYRYIQWTSKRIVFGNPGGTGVRGSVRI